jgi:hypothetical protein
VLADQVDPSGSECDCSLGQARTRATRMGKVE